MFINDFGVLLFLRVGLRHLATCLKKKAPAKPGTPKKSCHKTRTSGAKKASSNQVVLSDKIN
jgi:hypothetical protein